MLTTVFLIVAIILFALAAFPQTASYPLVPLGLAFFAASFLVGRIG